jgi:ATP-dependent helicase/nuclease subunit A
MAERVALTPAQTAAVTAVGSAAVCAGAGSGKTLVLAERFVHLLRPGGDGCPPVEQVAQILAITFTEKAAGEMKRRIRELVGAAVATACADERPHWERVRRELLGAQVSTIHALCARLLRDNPLEAGIDPHAVVLDEYESRDFIERVIEAELLVRLRAGDPAARMLVARTRGLAGSRGGGAVRTIARLLDALSRLGEDGNWLVAATARATDLAVLAGPLGEAARALVDEVEAWLAGAPASATAKELAMAWPAWRECIQRLGPDTGPAEFLALAPLASLFGRARRPRLRELLGRDGDRLGGLLAGAYGAMVAGPGERAIARLVAEVSGIVAERKRTDAVLTFDDLVRGARTLLATHPGVARRYAGRFRAVLVDEFQDTDALQADVIRRLVAPEAALFVVGDEKQSIYRFRGAEVAVFKAMRDALGTSYPLGRNFRSQPAILAFVNLLAAAVFQVPAGAAEPEQWTRFDAGERLDADRPQTRHGPAVRLVTFAGEFVRRDVPAREAREIEARVLAEVIHDLHTRPGDAVAYGDVAVLFRTLNQVKAYEYALARRGIPHHVVKGRGFFQCQEVRDVVNLLGALARPDDGIALAAVLRSPLFGIDDDTLWRIAWPEDATHPNLARWFWAAHAAEAPGAGAPLVERARALLGELRRRRSRSAVADLLVRALAVTDLEAVHLTQFQGRQKVANVRKVIELARDFDRRGQGGVAEFVRRLRALDADDPREAEALVAGEHGDVVRLMTIHQAKGLEFPVVVLVDLGRPIDVETDTVVLDRERGVLAAPVTGPGAHPLRHAGLDAHRARERERAQAEYARLFYVACTRAADELVLLEGRGKASHLERGDGDPHVWCHRLWDVIGSAHVAEAVRGPRVVRIVPAAGVEVSVEPAGLYLERSVVAPSAASEPREGEPSVAVEALVDRVLAFEAPRPRELVTSPTALATFGRCPRQYWYQHVIGLDPGGGQSRTRRLAGLLAHGVLEEIDVTHDVDAKTLAALARRRPETLRLGTPDVDGVVADLDAAIAFVRREVADGLTVLAREEPVVIAMPAATPELVLYGRIDVLARRDGALVVQDYKYAEASPARVREYGDQLAAYRLAVERRTGEAVAGEIVFVRGTPSVASLPPLDAAATEAALLARGRALAAVAGRREAEALPRAPEAPAACRALGCGFVGRCWRTDVRRLSDSARHARRRTGAA